MVREEETRPAWGSAAYPTLGIFGAAKIEDTPPRSGLLRATGRERIDVPPESKAPELSKGRKMRNTRDSRGPSVRAFTDRSSCAPRRCSRSPRSPRAAAVAGVAAVAGEVRHRSSTPATPARQTSTGATRRSWWRTSSVGMTRRAPSWCCDHERRRCATVRAASEPRLARHAGPVRVQRPAVDFGPGQRDQPLRQRLG